MKKTGIYGTIYHFTDPFLQSMIVEQKTGENLNQTSTSTGLRQAGDFRTHTQLVNDSVKAADQL